LGGRSVRILRLVSLAATLAGLGLAHSPVNAQQADTQTTPGATAPPPQAVPLPSIVVQAAPARRNRKKAVLKAACPSTPPGASASSVAPPSTTGLPGRV